MNILVSALYISNDKNYSSGGSMKYFSHLVDGLKNLGYTITALPKNELYKVRNFKFDYIITSHQETLREIAKNNIHSDKHCHVLQGIVPIEEQALKIPNRTIDFISISEEVKNHNLLKYGIDSRIVHQPYNFHLDVDDINISKNLPIKILHIKGNSTEGSFVNYSNKLYTITESDQSTDIMDQIKNSDVTLAIGRGTLDSIAFGVPNILGDCRNYIGKLGDGLLTKDKVDESLKFNLNGKRFKYPLSKEFIDKEVIKYIQEFTNDDMKELYSYFVELFDCTKIASEILNG